MAQIIVTEPVRVYIGENVYLVEPKEVDDKPGHKVSLVWPAEGGETPHMEFGIGRVQGNNLFLEVGSNFILGLCHSFGCVDRVEFVEPHN